MQKKTKKNRLLLFVELYMQVSMYKWRSSKFIYVCVCVAKIDGDA